MKNVLITGGAGGLGLATAEYLAQRGWHVFAADYNKDALSKISHQRITPIYVDISSDTSVAQAVDEVKHLTDSLDGVVNFAGILAMGSVIENDTEMMRRILDINLLGMYRINRAFFDMIRMDKGRIINVSSEYGVLGAVPFHGFYTVSKHAVEVYSDALRRELMFLGIPVIKIRPGAFRSNMQGSTEIMFNKLLVTTSLYKSILSKMHTMMESKTAIAKDPVILAHKVYKALVSEHPRLVYSANHNISQKLISHLPARVQDLIYKLVFNIIR